MCSYEYLQRGNSFRDLKIFQIMEHAVLNESVSLHTANKRIKNKAYSIVWHCGNLVFTYMWITICLSGPPKSERI